MLLPQPERIVLVRDGTRCSVMDVWELGGGEGRIRNKHVFPANANGDLMVEFDDSPGFWWGVPRELVVWERARQEESAESSGS